MNKDSKVIVTRARKFQTQDGRIYEAHQREVLTKPLNLGSINNPSKESEGIVKIECNIKEKRNQNFFSSFFGGEQ